MAIRSKYFIPAIMAAILAFGAFSASPVMATANPTPIPTPTTAAQLPPTVTLTVSNSEVSASAFATKRVTILSNIMAKGLPKKVVQKAKAQNRCRWIGAGTDVPGYWNSGHSANGGLFWFWDTRHVQICLVNGQWRKVTCGNGIRFTKPKTHVVVGRVIMVKSFANLKVTVRLHVDVTAKGVCGSASGSASLVQKMAFKAVVKAKGSALVRLYLRYFDKASVRASARVHCEVTEVTVVVPPSSPPPVVLPPVKPPLPVKPPPPHVLIVKRIKVDGVVSTPSNGMFSFRVTGGGLNTTVTNLAPSRDVGMAPVGSTITVCENQPADYNPEGGLCQTGKVTSNGITFTFVNVKTKVGTVGPGTGTPGQPGGPGAGGDPAPPQDPGTVCRNSSGDIVPGPADQFGYCT